MTVSNTDSPVKIYNGTATEYPIPFDYISDNDILVTLYNTTTGAATDQTIDVDYTISDKTVIYSEAPGSVYNVVIRRVTPYTQEASFGPGEEPPLSTYESSFDKLTMLAQDLDERLSRCVIFPDSYSGEDFTLPDLAANAGKLVRINTDGDGFEAIATIAAGSALDVTAYCDAADLEKLHDITSSATEINQLHDITSSATEINQLHESGVVKADLVKLHDITASASEINTITSSGVTHSDLEALHNLVTTNGIMVGYFQRPVFAKDTGNSITIGPGVYHHAGTTDQAVYWSSTLTKSLTVTETRWYYLYLSDSSIVTNGPEITADQISECPTAPTWSDAKRGWYNENDRCIFAVHVTSGNVDSFYHDGDYVEYALAILNRYNCDLAERESVTLTIPAFSRRAMCWISAFLNGPYYLLSSPTNANGSILLLGESGKHINGVFSLITSADQKIYLALSDSSYTGTNGVAEITKGWFFPAGM